MNRLIPLAIAAVVLIGGAVFLMMPRGGDVGPQLTASAQVVENADGLEIPDMVLGADDAPVTVIEYASYTCPHCRRFHEGPFKEIKSDYIDTGKVKFIYREVYFDRFGLWASITARCGGGERFFGITDLIYERQSEWSQGDPATIAANLKTIGKTAGLTEEQLDQCFSDGANAQALVQWWEANAAADNINSTPSFIIDGRPYSNMSLADFREVLDGKLDS
ncbi:MAG: thioredoxin domain-containing protein [Pseudomonadota bacterium]